MGEMKETARETCGTRWGKVMILWLAFAFVFAVGGTAAGGYSVFKCCIETPPVEYANLILPDRLDRVCPDDEVDFQVDVIGNRAEAIQVSVSFYDVAEGYTRLSGVPKGMEVGVGRKVMPWSFIVPDFPTGQYIRQTRARDHGRSAGYNIPFTIMEGCD
jgi:hypothetical protein|tara:strand:- start:2716 stop:3192 length:477 start_codon:yes stop_codon:yes gene_type:complete